MNDDCTRQPSQGGGGGKHGCEVKLGSASSGGGPKQELNDWLGGDQGSEALGDHASDGTNSEDGGSVVNCPGDGNSAADSIGIGSTSNATSAYAN